MLRQKSFDELDELTAVLGDLSFESPIERLNRGRLNIEALDVQRNRVQATVMDVLEMLPTQSGIDDRIDRALALVRHKLAQCAGATIVSGSGAHMTQDHGQPYSIYAIMYVAHQAFSDAMTILELIACTVSQREAACADQDEIKVIVEDEDDTIVVNVP